MSIMEKLLAYVLGAPGAGKSTQCQMVSEELGWSHISAGDLLRAQVAAGTEVGKVAEAIMKEGKMVPSSMIVGLLKEALSSHEHTKVLIDGFPRVLDQLEEFEQQVRPCDKAIFYNVSKETALERLNQRSVSSGREDDNADTIHKRLTVFQDESMPVIEALRQQGKLVEIDAAAHADEVYAHTKALIVELEQQQRHVPAAEAVAVAPAPAAEGSPASAAAAEGPAASVAASAEAVAAASSAGNSAAHGDVALGQAAKPSIAHDDAPAVSEGSDTSVAAAPPATEDPLQTAKQNEPAAAETQLAGSSTERPASSLHAAAPNPEASGVTQTARASTAEQQSVEYGNVEQLPGQGLLEHGSAVASNAQPGAAVTTEPSAAAGTAPVSAAADAVDASQINMSSIRTPIVICGPSGVGKGTLINRLMDQYPDKFGFSVSHTTRAPRPGEKHGVHYNFTEIDAMRQQVAAGLFLEHAEVHGNMYGTSLAAVANVSNQGKHCVLDIDVQGAQLVKSSALGHLCLSIFVAPPSHEELERRLRGRGTETEDKVLQRLANAEAEIAKAQEPGLFDHTLVNADLDTAYQQLQQLINQKVSGLLPEPVAAPAPKSAEANDLVAPTAAPAAAVAPVMANGNATHLPAVPQPAGATSTLLDFGFGASAGPAVAAKGMPVRQYMDVTVIPVLREGLKALNVARPDDPLQFLADYLVAHKPAMH